MTTKTDLTPDDIGVADLTWSRLAGAPPETLSAAARALGGRRLPPINTALASPTGFEPLGSGGPAASIAGCGSGSRLHDARGRRIADLGSPPVVDRGTVAALRTFSHVTVRPESASGPLALASVIAQLMVAGVPVMVDDLPLSARHLLGSNLAGQLDLLDSAVLAEPRLRHAWSVRARRAALLELTTAAGVGAPDRVTVVADLLPGSAGQRLLDQVAAQDWPALDVVLCTTDTPVDSLSRTYLAQARVVRAESYPAARQAALGACKTRWATFLSADLLYGPHHVTDLVLALGYARVEQAGVSVRRSYLAALDLTVEADGEAAERGAQPLTPGTVIAAPERLLPVDPGPRTAPGTAAVGYALHDLGVARLVAGRDTAGAERALTRAVRQWSGWHDVVQASAPTDSVRPDWAAAGRDAGYASYFTRAVSRPA